jgi:hypothetical protein
MTWYTKLTAGIISLLLFYAVMYYAAVLVGLIYGVYATDYWITPLLK